MSTGRNSKLSASFRKPALSRAACYAPSVKDAVVTSRAVAVTRQDFIVLLRRKEGAIEPFGDTPCDVHH